MTAISKTLEDFINADGFSKSIDLIESNQSGEYYNEVHGWISGSKSTKKIRKYKDARQQISLVHESCRLMGDCGATESLVEINVDLSVGSEMDVTVQEFKLAPKDEIAANAELIAKISRELELLSNPQGSLSDLAREMVLRYHRDGGYWLVDDLESDDNPNGAFFIDRQSICKPDISSDLEKDSDGTASGNGFDSERWEYGVVATADRPKFPIGFWVEGFAGAQGLDRQSELNLKKESEKFGFLSVEDLSFANNGGDQGDPFGTPTSSKTYKASLQMRALSDLCFGFLRCQMKTSVWKKYSTAVQNSEIQKVLDKIKENANEPEATEDESGVYNSKNAELNHMNVNSVEPALKKIAFYAHSIATKHGWPGWIITGDMANGNQHNLGMSLKPVIERLNSQRKIFTRSLVELIWRILKSELDIDDSTVKRLKKLITLVPSYPKLDFDSVSDRVGVVISKLNAQIISKAQAGRECDVDPDKMQHEISTESQSDSGERTIDLDQP